ncbi:MAG: ABC transporter transmembrane domain-containing protein [Elusimicrobiota bacterium]
MTRTAGCILRSALSALILACSPGFGAYEALAQTLNIAAPIAPIAPVPAAPLLFGIGNPLSQPSLTSGPTLGPASQLPSVKTFEPFLPAQTPLTAMRSVPSPSMMPASRVEVRAAQAAPLKAPRSQEKTTVAALREFGKEVAQAQDQGASSPGKIETLLDRFYSGSEPAVSPAADAVPLAPSPTGGRLLPAFKEAGRVSKEMIFGEAEYAPLVRPYRWDINLGRAILAGRAVLGTALGYATGAFVDATLAHAAPLALAWFGGLILLSLTRIVVERYQRVMTERLKTRMRDDFRQQVFSHLQLLPASYAERGDPAELSIRIIADADRITMKNVDIPMRVPQLLIQFGLAAGFVVYTSPILAAAVFASLPVLGFMSWRFGRKTAAISTTVSARMADATRAGQALLAQSRDLRASGAAEHAAKDYARRVSIYQWTWVDVAKLYGNFDALRDLLQTVFSDFLVLGVGLLSFVLTGYPSVGQVMSLRSYAGDLRGAFSGVVDQYNESKATDGGMSRLKALMSAPTGAEDRPDAADMGEASVAFEGVRYSLPGKGEVLKGADFSVQAGERVAVVGAEVSRRSLVDLLLRLDSPSAGSVLLGGADVAALRRGSIMANVALVQAGAPALPGTLRENLLFGISRPVPDAELWAALKAAGFDAGLPSGLDTPVEDGSGIHLTDGERQSLALARAVLKAPAVLIAEDLGKGLDPGEARRLREAFDRLSRGRTTLFFTDRPEDVQGYERALVLQDGAVKTR